MHTRSKTTPGRESNDPKSASSDSKPVDAAAPVMTTAGMPPPSYYTANQGMAAYQQPTYRGSKSVKSEGELNLQGPLDIAGSVKSGGSINFDGDFVVRDKIDAYGAINMNGNVTSEGRIKAYGNIQVDGYLAARDKIKGYGKLKVVGTLEGTELDIYGNLSIDGYLCCRRLVVYGSLTLIGPESTYFVEQSEEVAGAKLRRDQEADWDW